MPTKKYDRILTLVNKAGARFVSITFIKKDQSIRTIVFNRKAAAKRVKGEEASEAARRAVATRAENNPNLLNVWSHADQDFRSINMDTVRRISVDGHIYDFD